MSNHQFFFSDKLFRLKDVLAADSETFCKDILIKVKLGKVNIVYILIDKVKLG